MWSVCLSRNLECRPVARQQVFIHVAKLSSTRTVLLSGLFKFCVLDRCSDEKLPFKYVIAVFLVGHSWFLCLKSCCQKLNGIMYDWVLKNQPYWDIISRTMEFTSFTCTLWWVCCLHVTVCNKHCRYDSRHACPPEVPSFPDAVSPLSSTLTTTDVIPLESSFSNISLSIEACGLLCLVTLT